MSAFPAGEMIQLEPLVARVLANNPSPYTYSGTQTHLVGTTDLAVIDPGPDDAAHVEALLRAHFKPVLRDGVAISAWGVVPIRFRLDEA